MPKLNVLKSMSSPIGPNVEFTPSASGVKAFGTKYTCEMTTLTDFVASAEQALKKNDKISLIGFGTFSVASRKARTGHNPATGKSIKIPAKKVVKFKPGAAFAKMK